MTESPQLAVFQQATSLYNSRNFKQCLELLTKCVQNGPTSMVLNNRGIVHYRLGNISQATQDLRKSIKLDHLNFLAYFNLFSINTLAQQYLAAFDCLSLALSSLNTTKCREDRNIIYANQALHYCSNNKEAMMLKGLILLEQKEYRQSMEVMRYALKQESNETNRREIRALIHLVAGIAKQENTDLDIKFVGGLPFELKSSLAHPAKEQYQQKIKIMLQEFNRLYQSVLLSGKSELQSSGIELASNILSGHSDVFLKEDKNSNKVTANNSIVINDHDSSLSQHEKNKDSYNIILPQTKESLNFIDKMSQVSVIHEESSIITNHKGLEANKVESNILKQITFKIQYAQLFKQNTSSLYTTLQYNKDQNSLFITSLVSSNNAYYIWNELSEAFYLASNPQTLTLKLYSKDFSRFNDELIGKGSLLIAQLGTATIPLYRGNIHTGNIVMHVSMME